MNTDLDIPRWQHCARAAADSVVARDREARWDGALFRGLGAAGLLGLVLPREYGGEDRSAGELVDAMLGFGELAGDAGLALAWAAHTLACADPLWLAGSPSQRRRYLPALARGAQVGAWAHEDAADSPAIATRTLAGWTLSGAKTWVVNAPVADVFVVTARSEHGPASFVVERDTPGLTVGPRLATAGVRTAAIAGLVLDRCHVPWDSLLVGDGDPARACRWIRRWERGCLLAPWLGLGRAALAESLQHARGRPHFGATLAHSQAARARLADMKIRLELGMRMQAQAARRLDRHDHRTDRELAAARLFVGESVVAVAREAANVCTPHCHESGHPLERLGRDVPFAGLLGVGDDVLRSVLAGAVLGLG